MSEYAATHKLENHLVHIKPTAATHKMRTRYISNNCNSFKLLDLYCGAGLASWGYWLSGYFSEIVGIDIADMSGSYSFDFIQGDAIRLDYEFLSQFDFIHASPPCQAYSKRTPKQYKANHKRLINSTHLMLTASGKPYVIENVEGSSRELRPNIVMNGHSLGLPIDRRRYFHSSTLAGSIRNISCSGNTHKIHDSMNRADVIEALGLDVINPIALNRISVNAMLQGIPPLMTKAISDKLFTDKIMIGASV